jgi:RNA polymerase sigma-70 factor (ECF subfamily)
MNPSRPGLLQRLQQTGEKADWDLLVDLYSTPLFLWACRAGLQGSDAAELVREIFAAMARKLAEYRPGSTGGFRTWVRFLAHAERQRLLREKMVAARGASAAEPVAPVPAAAEAIWEGEYLPLLLRNAVELLQSEYPAEDWKACVGLTIEGRPASEVGAELGLSPAAVYAAESRVLHRVRQELEELID